MPCFGLSYINGGGGGLGFYIVFVWSAKLCIESVENLNKYLGKSLLKVVVNI